MMNYCRNIDVIIIGAGPAGVACAIQLKRFGIDSVIFEKDSFGGLIKNANLVENYLGFPEGISGVDFVKTFQKQFEKYNIPIIKEEVTNIESIEDGFCLNNEHTCHYLVIATGTKPKKIGVEIPSTIENKVFYEVAAMPVFSGKRVTIVGAGDAAYDYAINLAKENQVILLNRSERIRALPLLVDRAVNNKNIEYKSNVLLQAIEQKNEALSIQTSVGDIYADYFLCAIGREPNDTLVKKELKENPNLFIIGDVKNGILRQTAVATGDGLKAAIDIYERINN